MAGAFGSIGVKMTTRTGDSAEVVTDVVTVKSLSAARYHHVTTVTTYIQYPHHHARAHMRTRARLARARWGSANPVVTLVTAGNW